MSHAEDTHDNLDGWWREKHSKVLAELDAVRARLAVCEEALRKIDVDIIGLSRFDADGYCCICGGGNITHLCEGCVAHNALEDAALTTAPVVEPKAKACEVCKGTGGVSAYMNGRDHWHPCPRGCESRAVESKACVWCKHDAPHTSTRYQVQLTRYVGEHQRGCIEPGCRCDAFESLTANGACS